ncbi:MAG: nucleotidyl transferase AbiEii/AbiGii toxin family protein [Sphaerochaetaceae bacterium]
MLQKSAVEKTVYELLIKIMNDKKFHNFYLVGGTSIALRIGHRISIDLDLFTRDSIDTNILRSHLTQFYNFKSSFESKNTLKGLIGDVFVDFITYDYPLIKDIENYENRKIRMLSLEDVIAMKLSAIIDNGTRIKDFVDIAYLSTQYSLNEMMSFYVQKYEGVNLLSPVKALLYFADIDYETETVQLIGESFDWHKIENRLVEMVRTPSKVFSINP